MTKDQFSTWAKSKGYTEDRWGHFTKQVTDSEGKVRTKRYKVSSISVRSEVKSGSGWCRIASNYFKNLSITSEGKLAGLKM